MLSLYALDEAGKVRGTDSRLGVQFDKMSPCHPNCHKATSESICCSLNMKMNRSGFDLTTSKPHVCFKFYHKGKVRYAHVINNINCTVELSP